MEKETDTGFLDSMTSALGIDRDIDALSKSMEPKVPETSEAIAIDIAHLEEQQAKSTTSGEYLDLQSQIAVREQELTDTLKDEADTEGFLNTEFGQSLAKWGKVGYQMSRQAVSIYAKYTGDATAVALDSAGNILASPTTNPEDAMIVYKAVDKLNGNKLSSKVGNASANQALINSVIETSVAIGTPNATSQLLSISPNKQSALSSILNTSGVSIKSGDLTSIVGVTNVVTASQFNAANPNAAGDIGASYVPDKTRSDEDNAGMLVGVLDSLGTNWSNTSMYTNMNPVAKKALANPNIANAGNRLLEMTISDSYS